LGREGKLHLRRWSLAVSHVGKRFRKGVQQKRGKGNNAGLEIWEGWTMKFLGTEITSSKGKKARRSRQRQVRLREKS